MANSIFIKADELATVSYTHLDVYKRQSLYRPGPMDSIPTYLRNRHEPDKISYKTPQLAHILDVTNGLSLIHISDRQDHSGCRPHGVPDR